MSLTAFDAELVKLTPDELRRLAMKSRTAFVAQEGHPNSANECNEEDPRRLAALHEAIAKADATPGRGHSGSAVPTRLAEWTSK